MSFDFQVAICTYARARTLKKATLATLERAGVEKEQITIFVPNAAQRYEYEDVLGEKTYRMVVTYPGQFKCRQRAHQYYVGRGMEGERLIQIDDDVWGFYELVDDPDEPSGRNTADYEGTLEHIARLGYGFAESVGTGLWGMSYMGQQFYMDYAASLGNLFICGGFQGVYAGDDIFIGKRRTYCESALEDNETSAQAYMKYGKVIRFQNWSLKLTDNIEPGGIRQEVLDKGYGEDGQSPKQVRESTDRAAVKIISEAYPGLVKAVTTSTGRETLRFKNLGNTKIPIGLIEAEFGQQG